MGVLLSVYDHPLESIVLLMATTLIDVLVAVYSGKINKYLYHDSEEDQPTLVC